MEPLNRHQRRLAKKQAAAPGPATAEATAIFAEARRRHEAGHLQDAERLYRQALGFDPSHADSLHWLGIMAYQVGRHDIAADLIGQAIRARGDVAAYHSNLGLVLQAQGKLDAAASSYARALALKPDFVEARNNLGIVLQNQGKLDDAVACFEQTLATRPDNVEALANLGNIFEAQGNLDDAVARYQRAIALAPDFAELHYNLALPLRQLSRYEESFAAYRRHAALKFAKPQPADGKTVPSFKLKHDREQLDYLRGLHPGGSFDGLYHIEGGARIEPAAINPLLDTKALEAAWDDSGKQLLVVDNLLTPAALVELRRFCLCSTVWRVDYPNGYLGGFAGDGFACPLLAQITDELAAKLPRIIRHHRLDQLWGFKYDSELTGINIHADEAAINVNFWITPDDANLDPQSGGLVVWNVPAPLDWNFKQYQNNGPTIRAFLAEHHATSTTVPYRCNRAVIFDSDLFHETDRIAFKPGYENRRINVTLLYGQRHDTEGR